ncbi:MAG: TPM domain-containing protein [Microscillaceae bacterium]|jgi:uncharacterized membrane protein YgcG|nr:TPM domain-containing protein [Microscillaceae bacterium]
MRILLICFTFCILFINQKLTAQDQLGLKYIKDETNTLNSAEKSNLDQKLRAYEQKTSNEIAIFIINSLKGFDIKSVANQMARESKIGKQGKDNGILLLIARQDRKMHFEVGYGLEGRVSDLASQKILNEVLRPQFRQQKYYDGLNNAIDQLIERIGDEYTAQDEPTVRSTDSLPENTDNTDLWWGLGAVGVLGAGGYLTARAIGKASQRARRRHAENHLQKAHALYLQTDWQLMKKYYLDEDVEKARSYFQEQLQIYTPAQAKDVAQIEALSRLMAQSLLTQDNESLLLYQLQSSDILRLKPDIELKKIANFLTRDSTAILNNPIYDASKRAEYLAIIRQQSTLFADKAELSLPEQAQIATTISRLKEVAEKPNLFLGYDMDYLEHYIQSFLQNQDWQAYKHQYTELSVNATQRLFEQKYQEARASSGETKKRILQDFYEQYILVFATHRTHFLEEISSPTYTAHHTDYGTTYGNTTIITSSYSDTNTYSDYKDYSDTSTYSDSGSSYSDSYSDSSFGGGDFGGGGSSSDW